jgi:hypothetical protein
MKEDKNIQSDLTYKMTTTSSPNSGYAFIQVDPRELYKDVFAQERQTLLNKLEEEVEKYFTKKYGKRCKTKDIDDFPEIKDDKDSNRCFVCEIWETVDDIKSIIAKLKRGGE